jgi:ubiquinol-cytochrome c reductase cytochrome b subunit
MAGPQQSDFSNPVINWIDTRLPIFTMMQKEYAVFPTPKNFNYFWNFGALATVTLVIMIATGIFLAMNYQPNSELAFGSVQHIATNFGWLLATHQNGASLFHSPTSTSSEVIPCPRRAVRAWMTGVGILLWRWRPRPGSRAWGQHVIGRQRHHQFFLRLPDRRKVHCDLAGRIQCDDPRPTGSSAGGIPLLFVLVLRGVPAHRGAARGGSNNPLGIDVKSPQDTVPFHPHLVKDSAAARVLHRPGACSSRATSLATSTPSWPSAADTAHRPRYFPP